MIKNIIKKILYKFYKIFFYKLRHNNNPISIKNSSIQYLNVPIINCENDLNWKFSLEAAKLISYSGKKNNERNDNFPLIESWICKGNETLAPNSFFLKEQEKQLNNNLNKNKKVIEDIYFVLPYYTSVFGHFTGDLFGSIMYYLEFVVKKYKLFLITPSEKWNNFFEKMYPNKVHLVKPIDVLENNLFFKNVMILPRMNTVQNYIFSNNILNKYLNNSNHNSDKVFLTSKRDERIKNIVDVVDLLKKKGFKIIDPRDKEILDLLQIIKSCEVLITEKASTLNNLHLCRNKPYYIFSSDNEKIDDIKKFTYAGIYKCYHKGLYVDIFCKNSKKDKILKPFKNQIHVDLDHLNNIF